MQRPASSASSPPSPIDFSELAGLWVPCAGSVTPWGTHLGSEEYPPDARAFETAADFAALSSDIKSYVRYFGLDPASATKAQVEAAFSPYNVGYPWEVEISEGGTYEVTKHYSMGRMAIELAYVMPDEKTAYISDDGAYVGFYMYVADTAGDLSAGTLYAMKWIQTSAAGGGSADAQWIRLGQATDAEIAALIDAGTKFSDIFETFAPEGDGSCTEGTPSNAEGRIECLSVKTGMEKAAAFLETRRYASMLGASTEFNKEEGITFDPTTNTLFVAMSDVTGAMLDDTEAADQAGPNDIRLTANRCGVVYALDVMPNAEVGSDYVAMGWRALVAGTSVTYAPGSPYAGNTCSIN